MRLTENLKKQILVVEDEGLIAADIQSRLERLGYPKPAIASSGAEALRCARSTPFDLVLMDIRLKGGLDGISTAQEFKDKSHTPVVYMTAYADPETINRAKLTDPLGYIVKPVSDEDLRSVVEISLYKAEMERRLRTSEAWLATTLRSVGEGIVRTNTSGEVACMNPIAEQLTGWSSADAFGCPLMNVLELFDESTSQPARNPVFDLFAGEIRTYSLISKKGSHTVVEVECSGNRSGDDLFGSIVVVRDISRRREMESRLIQSQKMEALSSIAGGLTHDFNNQLTIILGYAEELYTRLIGEDKEDALEIKKAASFASSITGQLSTLSRRDTARFAVLNVNDVICEIEPLISHSLDKTQTLSMDLGSPLGFVRCDRNQLKQALLNLGLYARDRMSAGGELRIESSTLEIDVGSPIARLYRTGRYVRLKVIDNGEGLDHASLSRIFDPIFSTKTAGLSAGMGLSIVHGIIVQSGGYISARSEIGRGMTFEILLPCVGPLQEAGEAFPVAYAAPVANAQHHAV